MHAYCYCPVKSDIKDAHTLQVKLVLTIFIFACLLYPRVFNMGTSPHFETICGLYTCPLVLYDKSTAQSSPDVYLIAGLGASNVLKKHSGTKVRCKISTQLNTHHSDMIYSLFDCWKHHTCLCAVFSGFCCYYFVCVRVNFSKPHAWLYPGERFKNMLSKKGLNVEFNLTSPVVSQGICMAG